MTQPSFVQFCTDVLSVQLSPAQRVLATVAFDGVEPGELTSEDREIARQLFGDVDALPPEARAVLVAVCGARAGKSYVLVALYSLWRALTADLATLAPGEVASALLVAPDVRLARQALRFAIGAARSVPSIGALIVAKGADSFALRRPDAGGRLVRVECLPATRGGSALRGRSLVSAALDEAAFFRDESSVVNDAEVFKAVAPRILPGGLVVIASTPWAEAGLLFELFSSNWQTPHDAMAVRAPTLVMLDTPRNRAAVAREEDRDPDNAAREFGAQFGSSGAGIFLSPADLNGALADVDPHAYRKAPVTVGFDLGLVSDSSAAVAVALETSGPEAVVVLLDVLELRPSKGSPLKLSEVVPAFCGFAARHGARVLVGDHHVIEPAREHVPPNFRLETIAGGADAKELRHVAVREAFRSGRARMNESFPRLRAQLGAMTMRRQTGGRIEFAHPRRGGSHGDLAAAFIVAAAEALSARQPSAAEVAQVRELNSRFESSTRWAGMPGRGF